MEAGKIARVIPSRDGIATDITMKGIGYLPSDTSVQSVYPGTCESSTLSPCVALLDPGSFKWVYCDYPDAGQSFSVDASGANFASNGATPEPCSWFTGFIFNGTAFTITPALTGTATLVTGVGVVAWVGFYIGSKAYEAYIETVLNQTPNTLVVTTDTFSGYEFPQSCCPHKFWGKMLLSGATVESSADVRLTLTIS